MKIRLLSTGLIAAALTSAATAGPEYELRKWTLDAGGVTFAGSTSGQWTLSGTIGQWDAAEPADAGSFDLSPGFWTRRLKSDVEDDGIVGITDLLIVLTQWGDCPDPPAACPGDLNRDGQVTFQDILCVLTEWSSSGEGADYLVATTIASAFGFTPDLPESAIASDPSAEDADAADPSSEGIADLGLPNAVRLVVRRRGPGDDMVTAESRAPVRSRLTLVDDDLVLDPAHVTTCAVNGLRAGDDHDLTVVDGGAVLDGTLRVSMSTGFEAQAGDSFVVLVAQWIVGAFEALELPRLPAGLAWDIAYEEIAPNLEPGRHRPDGRDVDLDGNVGVADLLELLDALGRDAAAADLNDDGVVNGEDLDRWLYHEDFDY